MQKLTHATTASSQPPSAVLYQRKVYRDLAAVDGTTKVEHGKIIHSGGHVAFAKPRTKADTVGA